MTITSLSFLVVEDHEFQRDVLLKILTSLGATKISIAVDGHSALKIVMASDEPIDIIISDLDMPGMDGMEFIHHLSEAAIPASLILASALESSLIASVETMAKAYGVNILGVIEKPVTPAKLEVLIKHYQSAQSKLNQPETADQSFSVEEIRTGLDNDEFEPYFQPKVELATGQIKGAEALARWRHPQHGIVAPAAFIRLMEHNGLIDALTWIMLRKSAEFCSAWRKASGLEVTISVNLSMQSLADEQLAERVTDLVRNANIKPRHIVLEVTESAVATNVGQVLENLSRLRMRGFGLSIDDYGTGYSSMQQLTRIAFTELKIDQFFVANANKRQSARIILESSLDMATKLNITSLAEGVETQQHCDLLRLLGCQLAQGYFIAKPMQTADFLKWIEDRTHGDGFARWQPG